MSTWNGGSTRPYLPPNSTTVTPAGVAGATTAGLAAGVCIGTGGGAGGIAGSSGPWQNVSRNDELKWKLTAIGANPHPALIPSIVALLLEMAESRDVKCRVMAAANRYTPYSRIIMMQDDESETVRETVRAIIEYNERNKDSDSEQAP